MDSLWRALTNNLRTMKKTLILIVVILGCINVKSQTLLTEHLSLNKGWLFHLGDIPFNDVKGHQATYNTSKAGNATGAASVNYDDSGWRELNLPHDWAVEMPFDENENIAQGFKKRGFGWYRRHFKVDESDKGKNFELQFDGISTHATIWLNGMIIHRNWCGYTSSYIDITPFIKYGDETNTIAIRVDAEKQEGWWYEGAGMYRNTWLVKRNSLHIITNGVYANPIRNATGNWEIPIEVTLQNTGEKDITNVAIDLSLFDKAGKLVAKKTASTSVQLFNKSTESVNIAVNTPHLWSVDDPYLYTVKTELKQDGKLVDEVITKCGFRTIRFDKDTGFYLNDKPLKIKGTCNHIDHAGVGVAVPTALWEFRLRKLKEMGSNAYRCAHNPPSREFLQLCDSIGILVMNENRNFNPSDDYLGQLQWLIRRDRNHPSVMLWSVFNEEPMQGTEIGYEMVRKMYAEVKKLDTTRPITAAMNGGFFTPVNVSHAVDVVGLNYHHNYDKFRNEYPDVCMTSSEDVSGLMQRGQFITDRRNNLLDSYDTQHPLWGTTHRKSWKNINERPYLAGCFVWTGFDYKGEPTPFKWPTVSSNFGIMDICGFPKTAYYIYQAFWQEKPILHIAPHWNWTEDQVEEEGVKVMVISNVDRVKLLLNGVIVGEENVDKYEFNEWYVPYKPGKLEAIGYKDGKEIIRQVVETTGEAEALQLIPDRDYILGDGWDAMPITVRAIDKKGRPIPTADMLVEFEVTGDGALIGVGNGNPNSHELDKASSRSLYHGLAQLIVQSKESTAKEIKVTAKAKGLKSSTITIPVKAVTEIPYVQMVAPNLILNTWILSPQYGGRPDPNLVIEDNDMNSWESVRTGQLQTLDIGKYIVYRADFTPHHLQQSKGGKIQFIKLTGKAEIWLNGKLLGKKEDIKSSDFRINFPPIQGRCQLNVLIEGDKEDRVGLNGVVTVVD
jgi:beta-galactosidase